MNKIIKTTFQLLLLGLATASITALIMKKNGTLDEFLEKFKQNPNFNKFKLDDIFGGKICMISENDCGCKNNVFSEIDSFKPSPNEKN